MWGMARLQSMMHGASKLLHPHWHASSARILFQACRPSHLLSYSFPRSPFLLPAGHREADDRNKYSLPPHLSMKNLEMLTKAATGTEEVATDGSKFGRCADRWCTELGALAGGLVGWSARWAEAGIRVASVGPTAGPPSTNSRPPVCLPACAVGTPPTCLTNS